MIKIQVIGNIGKDAISQTIRQNNYAKFSLADRDGKDQNGQENTLWVDCLKLDKEGKLTPFLTAGKTIFVEGKPSANAYTNKEGKAVASLTIWVNDLEFVASPKKEAAKEVSKEFTQDPDDMPDWLK